MWQNLILGLTVNHAKIELEALPEPPIKIAAKLNAAIDSHRQWNTVSQAGREDRLVLHAIRRTRFLSFIDDLRIELSIDEDGTTRLYASSRSRIGKGDLGQNARNLRQLEGWVRK